MVDGHRVQCFSEDEYPTLGHILIDYPTLLHFYFSHERELENLTLQLQLEKDRTEILRARIVEQDAEKAAVIRMYETDLDRSDRLVQKAKVKEYFYWAGIVLESVAIATMGVAEAVK